METGRGPGEDMRGGGHQPVTEMKAFRPRVPRGADRHSWNTGDLHEITFDMICLPAG